MEKLKIISETPYFARKRFVLESFLYFYKNPSRKKVKVVSKYKGSIFPIRKTVYIDVLKNWCGFDFIKNWDQFKTDKRFSHKNLIEKSFTEIINAKRKAIRE